MLIAVPSVALSWSVIFDCVQAFRLQQQLSEAIERRDEWREKDKETPQEERERLLQQVKADNQEIGSIEKMLE